MLNILIVIGNVLITAIFGVVACHFGKWWIILFSLLFMFSSRREEK